MGAVSTSFSGILVSPPPLDLLYFAMDHHDDRQVGLKVAEQVKTLRGCLGSKEARPDSWPYTPRSI